MNDIPLGVLNLLEQLNSYQYGYIVNGKVVNDMNNFFYDYRSLSIREFEKYRAGVCWDYVHYEANWFKKHGYKYETFYIQVQDEDGDCPSHTYLVFYLSNPDNGVYYFESSWRKYSGIERFDNINELHATVEKRHIEEALSKCYPNTYIREKYDAASKSFEHLNCGEYMTKVSKGRIKLENVMFIEETTTNTKDLMFLDISKNKQKCIKYLKQHKSKYTQHIDNYNGEIVVDTDKNLHVGQIFVGKTGKDEGFITGLWVRKEYRGTGLGKRLLNDAINKYNGIDLTVKKDNEVAVNMYRSHGFKELEYDDSDYYWMKLDESYVEEKMLVDSKDIYYNKDKFDSGEINLCFIVGHSGSGKSTMARGMADGDKIEYYELDDVVLNKISFTMENLKEYGDLIYSFFKGPGKKYYYTEEDRKTGKVKGIDGYYEEKLIKDFVRYAISYCKAHKSKKYVIEGIWILDFIEPSLLKDYAVYIKGTSFIKSTFRAANREVKNASAGENRLKLWFDRATNLKIFVDLEKELKMYRGYFTSQDVNEYVFPYQHPYEFVSESTTKYISPLSKLLIPGFEPIQGRVQIRESEEENIVKLLDKRVKKLADLANETNQFFHAIRRDIEYSIRTNYNNAWLTHDHYYMNHKDEIPLITSTIIKNKMPSNKRVYRVVQGTDDVVIGMTDFMKRIMIPSIKKDEDISKSRMIQSMEYETITPKKNGNNFSAGIIVVKLRQIIPANESSIEEDKCYGLPKLKKYPMPDEKHVISAIRFFNYVDKENEAELAKNIKKKMRKYNIPYSKVGEKNRLKKYLKEDTDIVSEWCFDNFDAKPVLVFDLGSVLVEQKQSFTEALMKSKLIPNELAQNIHDHIINTFIDNSKYLDYCSSTEYYKFMTDKASSDIKKYIPAALRVNLDNMGKLPYTDSLIKQLKDKGYTLLYLSNWSKWSRDEYLHNTFDFLKYFDGGIFSCDVKLMKPDHKIYEALLKKFNIEGKQCIFFDDKYENIKASIECGMYGVMFNKVTTPDWIRENLL